MCNNNSQNANRISLWLSLLAVMLAILDTLDCLRMRRDHIADIGNMIRNAGITVFTKK
jgi:hypothetical protein